MRLKPLEYGSRVKLCACRWKGIRTATLDPRDPYQF